MEDQYGSDFINVVDDNGNEYEFEVLSSLEYNGATYLAAIPVGDELNPDVIIFREAEEDGDPILSVVDDAQELEAVNALIIESLFEESDEV